MGVLSCVNWPDSERAPLYRTAPRQGELGVTPAACLALGLAQGNTGDTMTCHEATAESGFLNFIKWYFQDSLSVNKLFSKPHFGQGGLWLAKSLSMSVSHGSSLRRHALSLLRSLP